MKSSGNSSNVCRKLLRKGKKKAERLVLENLMLEKKRYEKVDRSGEAFLLLDAMRLACDRARGGQADARKPPQLLATIIRPW